MATIGEHDSAIRALIKKDGQDTKLSLPVIYQFMNAVRAFLVSRRLRSFSRISKKSLQVICVELEWSQFHDCSCIPDKGCQVLKSKCSIPSRLTGRTRDYMDVTTLEGKPIQYVPFKKLRGKAQSRLQKPYYTIYNNYLYLFNSSLEVVLVQGLFENPVDLEGYCGCNDTDGLPCYDASSQDFPIDDDLVITMYDMVLEKLGYGEKFKDDERNDRRSI